MRHVDERHLVRADVEKAERARREAEKAERARREAEEAARQAARTAAKMTVNAFSSQVQRLTQEEKSAVGRWLFRKKRDFEMSNVLCPVYHTQLKRNKVSDLRDAVEHL